MESSGRYRWVVAFGSNLGDRLESLRAARRMLGLGDAIERASRVYESVPMYVDDQPFFLNAALLVVSNRGPREMLARIQEIERAGRRDRSKVARYGPRLIDLDIVLGWAGDGADVALSDPDLEVPHPRMGERAFVLGPLLDVVSDWRDPRVGWSARDRYAELAPSAGMRVYCEPEDWA